MRCIDINGLELTERAALCPGEDGTLAVPPEGGGFLLPQIKDCAEQYLVFQAEVLESHSLSMHLLIYTGNGEEAAFEVRFGLLPEVCTTVCINLKWLEAGELFPESMPGGLKIVCHGGRVYREEISRVVLSTLPAFHDVKIKIRDMALSDRYPSDAEVPDRKLIDCFGQVKGKKWKSKTGDISELREMLRKQLEERDDGYPFEDWSVYGGWKEKKLQEGTGFFSRCKEGGRWWLADPLGYAYFSMGLTGRITISGCLISVPVPIPK